MSKISKVSQIAKFLNKKFVGCDLNIDKVCSINNISDNSVVFLNNKKYNFPHSKKALVILIENYRINPDSKCSYIYSSNPRLDFINLVNHFFYKEKIKKISKQTQISKSSKIGKNVSIGDYSIIKDNVKIGSNTVINSHVLIESDTVIGSNCYIKSGAIIGEEGFGFEKNQVDIPVRFPHIGNVVIGDNVEIGAKSIIARGTIDATEINDNVKIDDNVFIAHNVYVDKNTMIIASSEISGGVKIGKNCWIGPNSTIKDGLTIEDNAFLGASSNVSKNLRFNSKVGTLSNLSLRDIVKINKFFKNKKNKIF